MGTTQLNLRLANDLRDRIDRIADDHNMTANEFVKGLLKLTANVYDNPQMTNHHNGITRMKIPLRIVAWKRIDLSDQNWEETDAESLTREAFDQVE